VWPPWQFEWVAGSTRLVVSSSALFEFKLKLHLQMKGRGRDTHQPDRSLIRCDVSVRRDHHDALWTFTRSRCTAGCAGLPDYCSIVKRLLIQSGV
jgi:hypothetical protein